MENDIFEVGFDPQARELLRRIGRWAGVFYAAAILTFVMDMVNIVGLFDTLKHVPGVASNPFLRRRVIGTSLYVLAYGILIFACGYSFFQFQKKANRSLEVNSQQEFHSSLRALLRHAAIAAMLFIVNSIWMGWLAFESFFRRVF